MQNEIITESRAPLPRRRVVDVGLAMPLLEGTLCPTHACLSTHSRSLAVCLPGAGRCMLILILK